jgi:4-amino-4-deoxy-L-arabinose transferase-like glycosyltransferase
MRTTLTETITSKITKSNVLRINRENAFEWIGLTAIVILSAYLFVSNLSAIGYANHYYTAAVKSMLQSWHNFFFVAAEPGGSVSVDKPPVGLWLQTISAYFLGVNGFAVVLPQIIAGILSVILVYHLVRRSFGVAAGLAAALALAVTPVVIATDRNNTIDSTLIFTLLLAAWAFIKATETGKLRYLLLGVTLVGIGFNIKMLEAYLPLPAFYALYFLGSKEGVWRKLGQLSLVTVVLLAISLSWALAVDLTPANQRPFVGSSGDNSELSLITGYNGINRLLGMRGNRGGPFGGGFQTGQPPFPGVQGGNQLFPGGRVGRQPFAGGTRQPNFQNGPNGRAGFGFNGGGFGFGQTGRAGPLRLFIPPLSKEASWMLPFGLFGLLLLAVRTRFTFPLTPKHQAIVLWGGWLFTAGVFFSIAGFFHEYYLSTMAPPLAALVGIGIMELWGLREPHPWLSMAILIVSAGSTLALQYITASAFIQTIGWQSLVLAVLAAGVALSFIAVLRHSSRTASAGFAFVLAAMLITPGIWSALTNRNVNENQSLPSAYSGRPAPQFNRSGLQINPALLNFLNANTQNSTYLMAVPSSMQGADYVIATGRPVLYLGGFMGQDPVVNSQDLARLVANKQLRYIYWDARGRGFGGAQADISSWVTGQCRPVNNFTTTTRNSGAPDGTTPGLGNQPSFGRSNMQVSLYDCG